MSQQFKNKLSNDYVIEFCTETAMMLKTGISAAEAVDMLIEDEENKYASLVLKAVHGSLESGSTFSAAMKQTNAFPAFVTNMSEIGERTGKLDMVLTSLAEYYRRNMNLSAIVKNAVVFPLVLLVILFAVVIVLLTTILPVFNDVFVQLGSELSPSAAFLMGIGTGINNYAFFILAGVILLVLIIYILMKIPTTRVRLIHLWSKLTGNGKTGRKVFASRFASAMSMGLSSGFDIDESLDMAVMLQSRAGTRRVEAIKEKMKRKSFEFTYESGIFSANTAEWIGGFRRENRRDQFNYRAGM